MFNPQRDPTRVSLSDRRSLFSDKGILFVCAAFGWDVKPSAPCAERLIPCIRYLNISLHYKTLQRIHKPTSVSEDTHIVKKGVAVSILFIVEK